MQTNLIETLDVDLIEEAVQGKKQNEAYALAKSFYEQHRYHLARKMLGLVTRSGQHAEAYKLSMTIQTFLQEEDEAIRFLDVAVKEINPQGVFL